MKKARIILLYILLFLLLLFYVKPTQAITLPDFSSLSYYGKLSLFSTYAQVEGNEKDFLIQRNILPGLTFDYIIDLELEGEVNDYYLESALYFPSNDSPELALTLENHDWLLEYQRFELKLPTLQTSFNTQRLEGFHANRKNGTFHLFHGTKLYQTRSKTITILDEKNLTYSLFESTDGDMVENSEMVFLQGQRLQRYIDYKVNYLSGELKFITPLRVGSVIEVRYNYIPTGIPINDRLAGVYYQHNFDRSSAGFFYFDETTEIPIDDPNSWGGYNETKTVRNRYLGSTLNLTQEPFSLTGEMACTDPTLEKIDYGGNIHFTYTVPNIEVDYQLTTATKAYQGIGVVPITAGEKHTVTGSYLFNPTLYLDWNLARVKKSNDWSDTITQKIDTGMHYQFADKHWLTLSLNTSSVEEWGETSSDLDVQVGWEYKISERASLAYKNSLYYLNRNQINFKLNSYPLRIQSEYKQYPEIIPYYGKRWVREFNTDWTWRPHSGISLTGDIDYWQPFENTFLDSRRRLALTLLAIPHQRVNVRSNYIYYFNPDTRSQTLFYDLASTIQLPYNLLLDNKAEKIEICSDVLTNTDQNWSGTLTLPITKQWKATLSLNNDEKEVFLKEMNQIYQEDNSFQRILSTTYQISDPLSFTISVEQLDSLNILGDSELSSSQNKLSFITTYAKNLNLFKYEVNYLKKNQSNNQWSHLLSWNHQISTILQEYSGELTHTGDASNILHHKETLNISWLNYNLPFRPSLQLIYQSKNDEGQHWEKFKVTTRLAYEFSWSRLIFTELGHIGNVDYKDTTKNYWGTFIKAGIEYSF